MSVALSQIILTIGGAIIGWVLKHHFGLGNTPAVPPVPTTSPILPLPPLSLVPRKRDEVKEPLPPSTPNSIVVVPPSPSAPVGAVYEVPVLSIHPDVLEHVKAYLAEKQEDALASVKNLLPLNKGGDKV